MGSENTPEDGGLFFAGHVIADPSLAVAASGIGSKNIDGDYGAFSRLFECLCLRDLKVYAGAHDAEISCYRDRYDVCDDCVVTRGDGRYALIEFAPGVGDEETAKIQLEKLERVISRHNEKLGKGECRFRFRTSKSFSRAGNTAHIWTAVFSSCRWERSGTDAAAFQRFVPRVCRVLRFSQFSFFSDTFFLC